MANTLLLSFFRPADVAMADDASTAVSAVSTGVTPVATTQWMRSALTTLCAQFEVGASAGWTWIVADYIGRWAAPVASDFVASDHEEVHDTHSTLPNIDPSFGLVYRLDRDVKTLVYEGTSYQTIETLGVHIRVEHRPAPHARIVCDFPFHIQGEVRPRLKQLRVFKAGTNLYGMYDMADGARGETTPLGLYCVLTRRGHVAVVKEVYGAFYTTHAEYLGRGWLCKQVMTTWTVSSEGFPRFAASPHEIYLHAADKEVTIQQVPPPESLEYNISRVNWSMIQSSGGGLFCWCVIDYTIHVQCHSVRHVNAPETSLAHPLLTHEWSVSVFVPPTPLVKASLESATISGNGSLVKLGVHDALQLLVIYAAYATPPWRYLRLDSGLATRMNTDETLAPLATTVPEPAVSTLGVSVGSKRGRDSDDTAAAAGV